MPTEDQVREQLKHLDGVSSWLGKREIKSLPSILWPDEQITGGVQGVYSNRFGMLIGTSVRLIFVEKSVLGRLTVEDFPYDKITSIQYEVGWVYGKIRIFGSGNRADIEQIPKGGVQAFAEAVRARITPGAATPPASSQTSAASSADMVGEIKKLAALHVAGHLTVEEFTLAKQRLLAG